jgi:hypothetical protein
MAATKTPNVSFTLMVTTPPSNATNSETYKAVQKAKEKERIKATHVTKPDLMTQSPKGKARTKRKVGREKENHLLWDLAPHAQTSRATIARKRDT